MKKQTKKNKNLWLKEGDIEVGDFYFTTAKQYRVVLAMHGDFLIYAPSMSLGCRNHYFCCKTIFPDFWKQAIFSHAKARRREGAKARRREGAKARRREGAKKS